jgi:Ubiquitin fusion degradation protein UFD1
MKTGVRNTCLEYCILKYSKLHSTVGSTFHVEKVEDIQTFKFRMSKNHVIKLTLLLLLSSVDLSLSSSSSSSSSKTTTTTPISFQSGFTKIIQERLSSASTLAQLEQDVEDWNAQWVATSGTYAMACSRRRLICLPLDDGFNPPMGVFSHNHVQTGDKLSVPKIFWHAIETNKAEVPWLFEISKVNDLNIQTSLQQIVSQDDDDDEDITMPTSTPSVPLSRVVGGPLDFRSPANYCFLPWWMMRALHLEPRDVVDVRLCTDVPPGAAAQLRPHSSKFAREVTNPQAVLETEFKHYSSLTKGAVIALDYNNKRYWFDVVDLRSAPRGEKCDCIKVQDCDIATDFLPAKDEKQQMKKKSKSNAKKEE